MLRTRAYSNGIFVVCYPDGMFVAVDDSSGGYPYPTSNISYIKFFSSGSEAHRYSNIFLREKFTVHKSEMILSIGEALPE